MEYTCIVWDPYQITTVVLKESNIEWQDEWLHQTRTDLTVYQTYCNLLHGQH